MDTAVLYFTVYHVFFHAYHYVTTTSDIPNTIQVLSGPSLVLGMLYGLRKFNCSEKRCPRIGKHKVEGTTYRTCSKHTTVLVHVRLMDRHAVERPEQHELTSGAPASSPSPPGSAG